MNKQEIMYLQAHFYQFFDRLGEDVYYDYKIEYDWTDILQNNFNKNNFKVIPIGFSDQYDAYFSRYNINKKNWEEVMLENLLRDTNGMIYEEFFENLAPKQADEYDEKF